MRQRLLQPDRVLAALVLTHLAVSMLHGFAHSRASVMLSGASMGFVFAVILVGPVLGLIVQRWVRRRAGAWIIAATLAGSLAFGLANHFLIPGADHVTHVAGPWRLLFGMTAALLVITETLGTAAAFQSATRTQLAA